MPVEAKLAASASTMLLLSSFFIIQNGVQSQSQSQPQSQSHAQPQPHAVQCHWCGPLAEQVHRSRRAPPCDEPGDHVAACDPGYPYCAIVATSPPYVESRYCVKIYQDECYPLFCNSTRTWRMTCPCRGDLCNGANAEREIDSFALLSNLVAKTHSSRIKKRSTETESQSISENTTENVLTNNLEPETDGESAIKTDEILNNNDVLVYVPGDDLNKDKNDLGEKIIEDNNQTTINITPYVETPAENEENLNLVQADEPMKVLLDIKPENILHGKQDATTPTPEIIIENPTTSKMAITYDINMSYVKSTKATDFYGENKYLENETIGTMPTAEALQHNENQANQSTISHSQIKEDNAMPFVKSTKATNVYAEKKFIENETKEKLPTAEALQHNENQASQSTISDFQVKEDDDKTVTIAATTASYTTPSTLLTTLVKNTNTRPTNALPKGGKNSAPIATAHIMLPAISFCILRIKH